MPRALVACEYSSACPRDNPQRSFVLDANINTADELWLRKGSKDAIWPDALAREQIEFFTTSPWTKATVLEGGSHFLSVTHAKDVNAVLLEMIENFS